MVSIDGVFVLAGRTRANPFKSSRVPGTVLIDEDPGVGIYGFWILFTRFEIDGFPLSVFIIVEVNKWTVNPYIEIGGNRPVPDSGMKPLNLTKTERQPFLTITPASWISHGRASCSSTAWISSNGTAWAA
jgi:hypothetical protein